MDAAKLLDTPLIIVPGMSDADIDAEWNAHVERVRMTDMFLAGEIDPEYYCDFMAQQSIDPEELLDAAEENLEFAIAEGLVIER